LQVDFDQDMVIGSDAVERMASMGACGLCALLLWLHCCWYGMPSQTLASAQIAPRLSPAALCSLCDALHRCTSGSAAAAAAGSNFQHAALNYAMQVSARDERRNHLRFALNMDDKSSFIHDVRGGSSRH
jgi:hypothetical protein